MTQASRSVRRALQEAAVALFAEQGFERTTAQQIAERAGVTERTFFRHFADKREALFDGESDLIATLTDAVAAVRPDTAPLPTLEAAFHATVPLLVRNRPVSEPRAAVIAASVALRERAMTKNAVVVDALAAALGDRDVPDDRARFLAQIAMDTFATATERWLADATDDLHRHLDRAFDELRSAVGPPR